MKLFIILSVFFFSLTTHGKVGVKIDLLYESSETGQGTTTSGSQLDSDISLLYLGSSSWVWGLTYNRSEVSSGLSSAITDVSLGPSFGWMDKWFFILTYLYSAEQGSSRVADSSSGSLQLEVGYWIKSGGISVGPQLTYRAISYNKDGSDNDLSPEYTNKGILPRFSFMFSF